MTKRFPLVVLLVTVLISVGVIGVFADSATTGFESPTYSVGNINGQAGWSKTGPYDVAVVANTYGIASFGGQTLRVSDGVTSGGFGDQTFSWSLTNEAGEAAASNGGKSGGTRQRHYEVSFDLASAVPGAEQPGLHMSVSPDRGDGARMSYLRIEDKPGGIDVYFSEVQQDTPCVPAGCATFEETQVASGLNRAVVHNLKLSIDFKDGLNNDVVLVYIDGAVVYTGTTWEGYYANDPESADGSPSRTVDSLLIRLAGTSSPGNFGKGFLIDNLKQTSSLTKDQCKGNGWVALGFSNQGACISSVVSQSANH